MKSKSFLKSIIAIAFCFATANGIAQNQPLSSQEVAQIDAVIKSHLFKSLEGLSVSKGFNFLLAAHSGKMVISANITVLECDVAKKRVKYSIEEGADYKSGNKCAVFEKGKWYRVTCQK